MIIIEQNQQQELGEDEGQYIAFQPISITVNLGSNLSEFYAPSTYSEHIIKSQYTVSGTNNSFVTDFYEPIRAIEKSSTLKLDANDLFNKIFDYKSITNPPEEDKQDAMDEFNKVCKSKLINNTSELEKYYIPVCKYYEYVQFKRARFNCNGVTYNEKTGRIISMVFDFAGTFQ